MRLRLIAAPLQANSVITKQWQQLQEDRWRWRRAYLQNCQNPTDLDLCDKSQGLRQPARRRLRASIGSAEPRNEPILSLAAVAFCALPCVSLLGDHFDGNAPAPRPSAPRKLGEPASRFPKAPSTQKRVPLGGFGQSLFVFARV
jgi:hypothetical protein